MSEHHRPDHAGGPTKGEPAILEIEITGGDDQTGEPGETLGEELRVRVTDGAGDPVRQFDVSWAVEDGGGSLSENTTRTDGQGRAEVEWTLPAEEGTYTTTVRAGDESETFTAVVLTGDPSSGDDEESSDDGSDDGDGSDGDGSNDDDGADDGDGSDGDGSNDGDGTDEGALTIVPGDVLLTAVGAEAELDVDAEDADGSTISADVEWASTDDSVADVDQEGTVVAQAAGVAYVIAAAACCSPDTIEVTVEQTIESVDVSPSSAEIDENGSVNLDGEAFDGNGYPVEDTDLEWTSSDLDVATVDSNGRVTAVSAGSVRITASAAGASDHATVDVLAVEEGDAGGPTDGIWISQDELSRLSTSGAAWDNVKGAADSNLSGGYLSSRDDHGVRVMAGGLVAARLDHDGYRGKVRDALADLMDNGFDSSDGLVVNRKLVAYVVAADLIDLASYDSRTDARFRDWLEEVRTWSFSSGGGGTIAEYHERRPNNYGTMAGASRMATALYLGDTADFDRAMRVFRGWLGDRSSYAGFKFGSDLSWQADENAPVGVNPQGARKDGRNIDGVLPDDQRRCGSFGDEPWPCTTNYSYGALAGALAQAQILHQQGYDAFGWEDRAILRVMTWLHEVADQPADGDREWQPHLVNGMYGTSFPAPSAARPGKNVGWADWTHR